MPAWLGWTAIRSLPWKYIGAALAALTLALLIWRAPWAEHRQKAKDQIQISALNGTIANMKAASAKALADNEAYVARINGLQDQITKDVNNDAPKQITDGAAAIAAYIRLHPGPKADPSGAGKDRASGIPNAPGQPDAPTEEAVVSRSDLNACNEAYVTATGLQNWIRQEAAIPREPDPKD